MQFLYFFVGICIKSLENNSFEDCNLKNTVSIMNNLDLLKSLKIYPEQVYKIRVKLKNIKNLNCCLDRIQ